MLKKIPKLILPLMGIILTWILVVPIFEFPDEQAHFETVTFVKDNGRVSVGNEKDMTKEMYETQNLLGVLRNPLGQNKYTYHPEYNVEYTDSFLGKYETEIKSLNSSLDRSTYVAEEAASYPILYYRFMSVFTSLVNGSDLITRLFVTRLGGLLIAFFYAYATYLIGKEVFRDKLLAMLLPIISLLQPMMSFVTAGINSDNLHNLLFTVLIYLSLRIIKLGLKLKYLLLAVAIALLDIYTKPQGFVAIPVCGMAAIIAIIRHKQWKTLFLLLGLGIIALLGSLGQLKLYQGLFSVVNNNSSFIEYLRFSANKLLAQNVVWYWGVFKWLGVVLPPIYWQIANRIVLLAVLGMFIYFFRALKKKELLADLPSVIFLILVSLTYATVIFWYDWQYIKIEGFSLGIQARYFFPTLVAHMTLLLAGVVSLGWNKKIQQWLAKAIFLLFLWLQVGGLWRVISVYYDPAKLFIQMSQYKPFFAKGIWWALWTAVYLMSLITLIKIVLFPGNLIKKARSQS